MNLGGAPKRIQKAAVRFLRYQRRWIADKSPLKLMVKSRRVGGSEVAAYSGGCKATGFDPCTGRLDVTKGANLNIVSASHSQARVMLGRAIEHIREMEQLPEDTDRAIAIAKRQGLPLTTEVIVAICDHLRGRRPNQGHIFTKTRKSFQAQRLDGLIEGDATMDICRLSNGAVLRAFAANPRTVRSFEGHVIGDEWGVMPHAQQMWAAMEPVARATLGNPEGFTIELLGTPCGDDNLHYEFAMTEAGKKFSRHRIDIYTAIRDGFPLKGLPKEPEQRTEEAMQKAIASLMAECGLPEIFEQEYNCAFLSASTRFISIELVNEATYFDEEELKMQLIRNQTTRSRTVGHDVAASEAKSADPCANVRNHAMGDPDDPGRNFQSLYWMDGDVKTGRGVSFATQEEWIAEDLASCPRTCRMHATGFHKTAARRVGIDETGLGADIAQRLVRKWGDVILPVNFTRQAKELMATKLKYLLEKKQQRIPDNIELRRGLLNLHRILRAHTNKASFEVKRTNEGGHGDVLWALMLAQFAAEAGPVMAEPQRGWIGR